MRPATAAARPAEPRAAWRTVPLAGLLGLAWVPSAPHAAPLDCMIQPSQIVQVGTPVPGTVELVAVERGDAVRRGQLVVQLHAGVERAALSAAQERAAQIGEVQATRGSRELAQRELQRARELYDEQFVSRGFVDKAHAEAAVATGRSEQARERQRIADREVELARAQLAQRSIRSPIDGVVVDRHLAPGEFVDQKPLLRIASIDPLRVDVLVPAAAFGQVKVGGRGTVVPELFARSEHVATVKTVDRVIDAASNTFRVRLELPNPGGALPAGLRCKVDLGLPPSLIGGMASAPPAAPPRAPASAPGVTPGPRLDPVSAVGADARR